MKKGFTRKVIMRAFLIAIMFSAVDAAPPLVHIKEATPAFVLPAKMPDAPPWGAWPEAPAWVISEGKEVEYFISTAWTFAATLVPGKSILTDTDAFASAPRSISSDDIRAQNFPESLADSRFWRRNYNGVFCAADIPRPEGPPSRFLILHGENKNEAFPWSKRLYPNSVLPAQEYAAEDYSGYYEDTYRDYWPAYFAFTSGAWLAPGRDARLDERGPILWPSSGYLDATGKKVNGGLRHPSCITHDGFLHVYYLDSSQSDEEGRLYGVKLARAPLDAPDLTREFHGYYNGAFDEPSLPPGFDPLRGADFIAVKGGRTSLLHPELGWGICRFSVARAGETGLFLSVEEHLDKGNSVIHLRASRDLVHWGDRVEVPGSAFPWGEGLHYPILANAEYTSTTSVDPKAFLIVGSASSKMKAIRVRVEIG